MSWLWLSQLHANYPTAQAIGIVALVCTAGMAVGSIKVRGIGLGPAGVLFAGILIGYLGKPVNHEILEFVKEFGLILFVFTIGLQLGPGFFSALRRQGTRLNALAAGIVILGSLFAITLGWLLKMDFASSLGLLAGATTNTPSLGAVQQVLANVPNVAQDRLAFPAIAYAVSYPGAVIGIIGSIILLKVIYRMDPEKEMEAFKAEESMRAEPVENRTLVVENPNLMGHSIDTIPFRAETGVTVSRHRRAGEIHAQVAVGDIQLQVGDAILVSGTPAMLDQFEQVVGRRSDEDLYLAPGDLTEQRLVVTRKGVIGKTIGQLMLDARYGAVASRVARGEVEMTARSDLRLQFGDVVQVVGDPQSLERAATLLGNSEKKINETQFVPIFIGIFLGIALGTLPLTFPGLPRPIRLGLAAGPLIVALVLGRVGCIGGLIWHMPMNANIAFREFGISLFFAAVGLDSGPRFFSSVFSEDGLLLVGAGFLITVLPLLAVGIIGRSLLKLNFVALSGLISGSYTDPPALGFSVNLFRSDGPTLAYTTVYPLTMLLRILFAQLLALTLIR
jgi:putative transport protein